MDTQTTGRERCETVEIFQENRAVRFGSNWFPQLLVTRVIYRVQKCQQSKPCRRFNVVALWGHAINQESENYRQSYGYPLYTVGHLPRHRINFKLKSNCRRLPLYLLFAYLVIARRDYLVTQE